VNNFDRIKWDVTYLQTETIANEETPVVGKKILKIVPGWSQSELKPSNKGIEIRNLILRSQEDFCMDT
jgi:hypothetical protein